jgi:hypothetical protein
MALREQWCPCCHSVTPHEEGGQLLEEDRLEDFSKTDKNDTWKQNIDRDPGTRKCFEVTYHMGEVDQDLTGEEVLGYIRKRQCQECRKIWRSIEIPAALFASILRHLLEVQDDWSQESSENRSLEEKYKQVYKALQAIGEESRKVLQETSDPRKA